MNVIFNGSLQSGRILTATGAPASGPAPMHEAEPKTPGRRPALRHPISLLVAVSRCAPPSKPLRRWCMAPAIC